MFIDISGFTQMTETLMRGGDEGAEILSNILNEIWLMERYGGINQS